MGPLQATEREARARMAYARHLVGLLAQERLVTVGAVGGYAIERADIGVNLTRWAVGLEPSKFTFLLALVVIFTVHGVCRTASRRLTGQERLL